MRVLAFILVLLLPSLAMAQQPVQTTTGGKLLSPLQVTSTPPTKQLAAGLAYTPNTVAASTSSSIITRKCGFARTAITSQKLVYAGFVVNVLAPYYGGEVANDNNESVNAWIEYPTGAGNAIGTTTTATFSGSATGTITAGTGLLTSDAVNLSIPNNTEYCVITYLAPNTGHIAYSSGWALGALCATCTTIEKTNLGTSGVPTTPGAFTAAGNTTNQFISPIAVIGPSNGKAICLLGDSRDQGASDTGDASHDLGENARSVGPFYPYINFGVNGQTANATAYSITGRTPLFSYCDAVLDEMGVNDTFRGGWASGVLSYKKKLAYLFSGHQGIPALPYSWTTLAPESTTSDSWATCTNQAAAANNAARVTFNTSMRSPASSGVSTNFDVSAALVAAAGGGASGNCNRGSEGGLFIANGTASAYTNDGTHETQAGNLLIKNSNVITPKAILTASVPTTTNPSALTMTSSAATYDTSTQKFGTAALSGGSLYVDAGSFPQVLPVTMAGWAKLNTTGLINSAIFQDAQLFVGMDPAGTKYVGGFLAGGHVVTDSVGAQDNTWHYLEVSYDVQDSSTLRATLCKDGALVGTTTTPTSTETTTLFLPDSSPYSVRGRSDHIPSGASAVNFPGEVDDVAIYNTSRYIDNGNACPAAPTQTFDSTNPKMIVGYHLDSSGAATVGPLGN